MAVGQFAGVIQSIASGSTLDIQPSAGVEWFVHNIWIEDAITIQRFDGTNTINALAFTTAGIHPIDTRVSNSNRIRIRNDAGTSKLIGYDAVITRE